MDTDYDDDEVQQPRGFFPCGSQWVRARRMPRSWSKFALGTGLASALVGRLEVPRRVGG